MNWRPNVLGSMSLRCEKSPYRAFISAPKAAAVLALLAENIRARPRFSGMPVSHQDEIAQRQ